MKWKSGVLPFCLFFLWCSTVVEAQLPGHLLTQSRKADSLVTLREYAPALEIKKKLVRRVMSLDSFPKEVLELQIQLARISRRLGDYPDALKYSREAISFGEQKLPDDPLLGSAYNALGIYYYVQSEPAKALEAYRKAHDLRVILFGANDPRVADVLNNMAICFEQQGDYGKALEQYVQALQIRFGYYGDCHPKVADTYLNIGTCWHKWGDFRKALNYYDQAKNIYETDLESMGGDLLLVLNNMGVCYQDRGDFKRAEELLELSLSTNLQLYPADHPEVAVSLNNLGLNFFDVGDYNKALVYFQRALEIRERTLEKGHPLTASIRNHIGSCYLKKKDYQKAFEWANTALEMRLAHFGHKDREVADSYNDIGLYYETIQEYDSAEINYRIALDIYINQLGKAHPLVADTYLRLGDCYFIQEDLNTASSFFLEALEIKKGVLGSDHPEVARIIARLSRCTGGNPSEGLRILESGLSGMELLLDPENQLSNISPLVALEILMAKSELLQSWQLNDWQNDRLYEIQAVHDAGLSWMDRALRSFQEPGSKQLLVDRFYRLLEMILENCEIGFVQTKDPTWIERAFTVSERGKGLLLREAVAKVNAATFSGIPESIQREEQDLQLDVASIERRIFEASDSMKEIHYGDLFSLKQTQYELLNRLQEEYPEYYDLRYGNQSFDLKKLQQHAEQEGLNILEYFQGDRGLYVFLLNADTLWMEYLASGNQVSKKVKTFRESLTSYNPMVDKGQDLPAEYGEMAYDLYNVLIEPLEELLVGKRLLVIPDGSLHYLPFDCLVGQPVSPGLRWRDLNFLLKEYSIGYAYTAELLFNRASMDLSASHKMLGVAPQFDSGGDLPPLLYNEEEINSVSATWPGKILIGDSATKGRFRKEAPNYRVLHLATHAEANDTMGSYSYLAFQGSNSGEDSTRLFARELYNMRLPADLVVLSACETGVGEWQRGEGMISLARGFFYSGAKALLTSLWKLDDRSSAELMASFYSNLRAGEEKDIALQKAKLDFIQNSSSVRGHPFFWASFVPVGKMSPVESPGTPGWPVWLGLIILIVAILGLFVYFKRLGFSWT